MARRQRLRAIVIRLIFLNAYVAEDFFVAERLGENPSASTNCCGRCCRCRSNGGSGDTSSRRLDNLANGAAGRSGGDATTRIDIV